MILLDFPELDEKYQYLKSCDTVDTNLLLERRESFPSLWRNKQSPRIVPWLSRSYSVFIPRVFEESEWFVCTLFVLFLLLSTLLCSSQKYVTGTVALRDILLEWRSSGSGSRFLFGLGNVRV